MTQTFPYQPGTAPGYPQQPYQQPVAQQPQFAPPQQQFPVQQGYPAPQYAAPAPPLVQGSLDDFFNQPSAGGGKSLSFPNGQYGTRYVGIVTRPLGPGDVQQQTDTQQRPQYFKDGRPKFVMKVPLQMQPSQNHPDGLGTWFVKGQGRDELVRAMAEAGAPAGPPEPNAVIDITYVSDRQAGAGMNPAKQFRVVYTRPNGAAAAPVAQAPVPTAAPVSPPAAAAPVPQPPAMPPQGFVAPPAAAPPVQQPAVPQPPAELTPEQQELLNRLTAAQ